LILRASCNESRTKVRLLFVRIFTSFPEETPQLCFAEILLSLLHKADVDGPILVNIMDCIMAFIPGSPDKKRPGMPWLFSTVQGKNQRLWSIVSWKVWRMLYQNTWKALQTCPFFVPSLN
jgi:hypothetical protein